MTTDGIPITDRPERLSRNHNFVLLWCAYGISAMGDHLSEMAVLKTQDALRSEIDVTPLNARMTFMFFVPFLVLAPLTGWLADRLPRRVLMIGADLVRCVIMFCFAGLIAWARPWGTWGPFLPLLVVGIFAAAFSPARSALLPTLIRPDQLVRANGMIAGLGIIATMAANLIGGYLARYYPPSAAFQLNAATYLASAICLAFIWPSGRGPHVANVAAADVPRSAPSVRDIFEGFRYVAGHRRVAELLVVASLVWFCGSLVNSVIPAVVRDVYGGTYQTMSGYRAFLGLGFILGATLITILGDALRSEVAISWGFFGIGVSVAAFAASVFLPISATASFSVGALGVIGSGVFGIAVMASFESLLQRLVPDRFRGRVFGVRDVCTTGALLLATGMLGVPQWTRVDRWVGFILAAVAIITFAAGWTTLVVRLRRSPHGPWLGFMMHLTEFVARFWWRLKVEGPQRIPHTGPVIVTANHRCPADPLLLIAAVQYRTIGFMVAEEYTRWRIIRSFMDLVHCIPVRRSERDVGATKQAIRHLRSGRALGIFIEGGIVPPGQSVEPKDGVAMLALRTGAMVIPAYISGTIYHDGLWKGMITRHRTRVHYGPPVDLQEFPRENVDRETLRAASWKIYRAIQALKPADVPA